MFGEFLHLQFILLEKSWTCICLGLVFYISYCYLCLPTNPFHTAAPNSGIKLWCFFPMFVGIWCTCEFDLELSCSCSAFLTSYFLQHHWRCLSWSHSKHLHTFIFPNASLVRSKITVSSTWFFFLSPESKLFLIIFPEFLVSLCPGRCLGCRNLPSTLVNLSRALSQPYPTSNTGL